MFLPYGILRYKDDPRFAAFCRMVGLPPAVGGQAADMICERRVSTITAETWY
jgi:hypothetical protein